MSVAVSKYASGQYVPGVKPLYPLEVDWSHPLSRGLFFAAPLNEIAGPLYNTDYSQIDGRPGPIELVQGLPLTHAATSGDIGLAGYRLGPWGPCWRFDSGSNTALETGWTYPLGSNSVASSANANDMMNRPSVSGEFSASVRFRKAAFVNNNWAHVIGIRTNGGGSLQWGFAIDTADTMQVRCGGSTFQIPQITIADEEWVHAIVRGSEHYNAVTAHDFNPLTCSFRTTGSATFTGSISAGDLFALGHRAQQDRAFDGDIDFAFVWDRYLPDEELFNHATDPFGMLRARAPRLVFPPAPDSGGGEDIALDGTVASVGAPSGDLRLLEGLDGGIAGSSAHTGAVTLTGGLTGTAAAIAAANAALRLSGGLLGSIDSTAVPGASLALLGGLAGAGASLSDFAGRVGLSFGLSGSVNSDTADNGLLGLILGIAGQIEADATLSGNLELAAEMRATAAAVSTMSGSLLVDDEFSATLTALSAGSGSLAVAQALSATLASISGGTASLDAVNRLSGVLAGIGDLNAEMTVQLALAASMAATSGSTAALAQSLALAGSSASVGTIEGELTDVTSYSGTLSASSSLSGRLMLDAYMSGTIQSSATLTCAMQVLAYMSSTLSAETLFSGVMTLTSPDDLGRRILASPETLAAITATVTTAAAIQGDITTH